MRTNSAVQSKTLVRWLLRSRVLVLGASVLVACENQPTTPMGSEEPGESIESIIEFDLTPEGARDAKTAIMRGRHKLPTVTLRTSSEAALSANVVRVDNSPFDLTYFGGRVVRAATSYNVYVNCPEGPAVCWGTGTLTPAHFLRDLNRSDFMNVVREYTGTDAKDKFPVLGMRTRLELASPPRATLQEIFHVVSDAVTRTGVGGYRAIYHIFLPQGTEMCIAEGECYSPSDPANWTFCAFHGSVNLASGRHVLFTVEPYQAIEGCQIPGQTPNGVIDATATTLAHELFETITDPDLDGWRNTLFGFEISDLCASFGSNQLLNGNQYFIQSEYSNKLHLCTNQAPV
jgi:hypothetical protein